MAYKFTIWDKIHYKIVHFLESVDPFLFYQRKKYLGKRLHCCLGKPRLADKYDDVDVGICEEIYWNMGLLRNFDYCGFAPYIYCLSDVGRVDSKGIPWNLRTMHVRWIIDGNTR